MCVWQMLSDHTVKSVIARPTAQSKCLNYVLRTLQDTCNIWVVSLGELLGGGYTVIATSVLRDKDRGVCYNHCCNLSRFLIYYYIYYKRPFLLLYDVIQVLSDYIVKNRGIMPGSARDAYDQYREVESIVMSTYKACTETDTEGDGRPFKAEVRTNHCLSQTCR